MWAILLSGFSPGINRAFAVRVMNELLPGLIASEMTRVSPPRHAVGTPSTPKTPPFVCPRMQPFRSTATSSTLIIFYRQSLIRPCSWWVVLFHPRLVFVMARIAVFVFIFQIELKAPPSIPTPINFNEREDKKVI